MKRLFRLRPRRVVAAFAVLGGMLLPGIGAVTDGADADACLRASVWIYKSKQGPSGREHKYGPYQCVGPAVPDWEEDGLIPVIVESDVPPYGTPSGVGVEIFLINP